MGSKLKPTDRTERRLLAALSEKVQRDNMVLHLRWRKTDLPEHDADGCVAEFVATMRSISAGSTSRTTRVDTSLQWTGVVDEERLRNFVRPMSVTRATRRIFRDLRYHLPSLTSRMQRLGLPGVFWSWSRTSRAAASSAGSAVRMAWASQFEPLLGARLHGIDYELRNFDDIKDCSRILVVATLARVWGHVLANVATLSTDRSKVQLP